MDRQRISQWFDIAATIVMVWILFQFQDRIKKAEARLDKVSTYINLPYVDSLRAECRAKDQHVQRLRKQYRQLLFKYARK
jgi:hypothetical protein